ncbi:MAG: SIR2 family protein [Bacteroidota bacterium]
MQNLDWKNIIYSLKKQRCVLFLGHSAYQAIGGGDITAALQQHLQLQETAEAEVLCNSDGFFLFREPSYYGDTVREIEDFYDQVFPETESLFTKLAQIPFNIIVTLTADNLLERTFDTNGFDYHSDFYFRNRKASDTFKEPTKQKPLIYNLLGSLQRPESLVLTHEDFFDYLQSVFTSNSMNDELKDSLERADRYIFLGLPYEKWYFQLLLRVLSMHSDKLKKIKRLALKEFENPELYHIYQEEFKFNFIPNDVNGFIDSLHQKCEEAAILKALPAVDTRLENIQNVSGEQIRDFVARNRLDDALLHLKALLQQKVLRSDPLYMEWIILNNEHVSLKEQIIDNTIYQRDIPVERSRVTKKLLLLLEKTLAL